MALGRKAKLLLDNFLRYSAWSSWLVSCRCRKERERERELLQCIGFKEGIAVGSVRESRCDQVLDHLSPDLRDAVVPLSSQHVAVTLFNIKSRGCAGEKVSPRVGCPEMARPKREELLLA